MTVVYGTLCGTVIPYDSRVGGTLRTFGTSGLLYQSNKLMFDEETNSLWSSLDGTPVIGPLVGSDLRLSILPVVTTTWGEWRRAHPETTVLSLETGFTVRIVPGHHDGGCRRHRALRDCKALDRDRDDPHRQRSAADHRIDRATGTRPDMRVTLPR